MLRSATLLLPLLLGGLVPVATAQVAPPPAPPVAPAPALPELTTLTARQVENVTALGQVWGLLKYYHPAVAAGQRDWDAAFRQQLPRVLACRTRAERSRLLGEWVASLGSVPACATCAAPPTRPVHEEADFRWLHSKRQFSPELRQQLAVIAANPYQGKPYYVSRLGGSTRFEHEEAYAEPTCPPLELRLLGLCRYWNMFQYFYPYKGTLGEDWQQVLPTVLPDFAAATTPLAYRHAALRLFTHSHDGHSRFYPPDPLLEAERGTHQVAASVQFLDGQAVVTQVRRDGLVPASPLQPGDVLTHLAGTPVAELVRQRLPETIGANRPAQLNTIALNLLFCAAPTLEVQVLRAGQMLRLTVPAVAVGAVPPAQPAPADSLYRFLTPDIGYVDMARISYKKLPAIMRTFAHTRGIVFDQRNYPGFVATQLPAYFVDKPTLFARFTYPDLTRPGRFVWMDPDTITPVGLRPYTGRVVMLVNEVSRSLAEFTAMAVQATPHATLLGSQTAGSDGNTAAIVLPGGLKTLLSGIGAYYPDGRPTQRMGVRLDEVRRPTIAGLRQGRDELRERAVEIILQSPPAVPN